MKEHILKAKKIGKNFNVVVGSETYTKVVEVEEGKKLMELTKSYNEKLEKTKSDRTVKQLQNSYLKELALENKTEQKTKEKASKKLEKKQEKVVKKKKGMLKTLVDNIVDVVKGKEEKLSEEDQKKLKSILDKNQSVPKTPSQSGTRRRGEY